MGGGMIADEILSIITQQCARDEEQCQARKRGSMTRFAFEWIGVAMVTMAAVACGAGGSGSGQAQAPTATPAAAPSPAATSGDSTATPAEAQSTAGTAPTAHSPSAPDTAAPSPTPAAAPAPKGPPTLESELTGVRNESCACKTEKCAESTLGHWAYLVRKYKDVRVEGAAAERIKALTAAASKCLIDASMTEADIKGIYKL